MSKATTARMAELTDEQRTDIAKKARAAISPERKSAIARKGAAARIAKTTPEQRSEIAKKANAGRSPETKRAIAEKAADRMATLMAKAARLDAIENGAAGIVTTDKKVTPADGPQKHNLSLLKKADGSWMDKVRPEVAEKFLDITVRHRQRLCSLGTLVKTGSNQRSFITVSSLLEYAGLA